MNRLLQNISLIMADMNRLLQNISNRRLLLLPWFIRWLKKIHCIWIRTVIITTTTNEKHWIEIYIVHPIDPMIQTLICIWTIIIMNLPNEKYWTEIPSSSDVISWKFHLQNQLTHSTLFIKELKKNSLYKVFWWLMYETH
jgi:hypothetical protein